MGATLFLPRLHARERDPAARRSSATRPASVANSIPELTESVITSPPPPPPETTQRGSWGWWIAGVVAVVGAGFYWKSRNSNSEVVAENPFQTITLNPIRKDLPRRQDTRFSHTTSVHKVAGNSPSTAPSARTNIPSAEHFIYAAAHDLQEPLRKVRSYMDRLENKLKANPPADPKAEVESVRKTLQRMQNLLDSLLSLARIQGKGSTFTTVELGNVIRDVLVDLEMRITESGAEVSVEGTLPAIVADATQLHQLFQNLIGNALKYHHKGRAPNVVLRVQTQEEPVPAGSTNGLPRSWCRIEIQDNGIGFDQSDWSSLLDGFRRLHSRDEFEGTGLGLTICRSIVDRHQGNLTATSQPDQGTTVVVTLPVHQHARSGDTAHLRGPQVNQASPTSTAPSTKTY